MLQVTDRALAELKRISAAESGPGTTVQRLVAGQYARLQFVTDDSGDWESDAVIRDGETAVLLIDAALDYRLDGWKLDLRQDINGTSLCFLKNGQPAPDSAG